MLATFFLRRFELLDTTLHFVLGSNFDAIDSVMTAALPGAFRCFRALHKLRKGFIIGLGVRFCALRSLAATRSAFEMSMS